MATNVMEDLSASLDFFALASAGAKLVEVDDDPESTTGFDVEAMFTPLLRIAAMIEAWRVCASLDGWPARLVELKHVADAEVFNTLVGFARLVNDPDLIAKISFLFRAIPTGTSTDDLERYGTTIYLPVVGNIAGQTLVLHLTTRGSTLSFDGDVVGFNFEAIESVEIEVRDRVEKSTIYPEIAPGGGAPTLALGVAQVGALPEGLQDIRLGWEEGTSDS